MAVQLIRLCDHRVSEAKDVLQESCLTPFQNMGRGGAAAVLAAAFQQLQHCLCSLCDTSSGAGGASTVWWALLQSPKRKMFFSLRDSWL